MKTFTTLASLACSIGLSSVASAQEAPKKLMETTEAKEKATKVDDKRADGWEYKLDLGFNFGFSKSGSVVGQPDGNTIQLGLVMDGSADLYSGGHEWHNTLSITHQQSQTPAIEDVFIKTQDNFELVSMWLYKLKALPWFGPFARARLQTQLFAGNVVLGEDALLEITNADGSRELPGGLTTETNADGQTFSKLDAGTEFEVTKGFEPLTLRQSVGAFARALDSKTTVVTFTLGLGAQEIFTRDGYAVADAEDSPELEIKQLEDSNLLGAEAGMEATGTFRKEVTWSFTLNTLLPLVDNVDALPNGDPAEGTAKLHVDIGAKAGLKLAKWVSLNYALTAKLAPYIQEDWQVQNALVLSSSFNLL